MISIWNEYRTDEHKESADVPDQEEFKKDFPF